MENIFSSFLEFMNNIGYPGIIFLMAIESSLIPLPSEIVIPPAAYLAAQGEMNIYLVVICGVIGSLIGSIINYYLAYILGRPIVFAFTRTKIAKLLLINEKKIIKSEKIFLDYGSISVFFARLLPVIRHLISIPAGFCKMNFFKFVFYTTLGSALWVSVLAVLGYYTGYNQEVIKKYSKEISFGFIILTIITVAFYFYYKKIYKKEKIFK